MKENATRNNIQFFESPIPKKGVNNSCLVAQIVEKFGGGNTHTSEGQDCDIKVKVIQTPKQKLSQLQDGNILFPSLGTAQLPDQWMQANNSPAKKIKFVLFD